MACLVPNCSCNILKKNSTKQKNKLNFLGHKSCSGCGHHPQLHRNFTSKDGLIIDELKAATTRGCNGHIPLTDLPSHPLFTSYSLIPILPNQEECGCACTGFHSNDISNVLLHFNKLSYDSVTNELPSLPCDNCTHPLINHQCVATATDHNICYDVAETVAMDTKGPVLIDVSSCDGHVTMCIVVEKGANEWRVMCERWEYFPPIVANRQVTKASKKRKREENDSAINKSVIDTVLAAVTCDSQWVKLDLSNRPGYLSCNSGDAVTMAMGCSSSVYVYKWCIDQTPPTELIWKADFNDTIMTLSLSADSLCVGGCNGTVRICHTPFDINNIDVLTVSKFSITCITGDKSGRYWFIGTECGDIVCYSIEQRAVAYSNRICAGPVTIIHWLECIRGVAVGSSDGCVYIVSMSTAAKTGGPIDKYFKPQGYETINKCNFNLITVLQGHRSFVSCIASNQDHLLTGGWDGILTRWGRGLVAQGNGRWSSLESPLIEDEPDTRYKMGCGLGLEGMAIGLWNISENVMCAYRSGRGQTVLALYISVTR